MKKIALSVMGEKFELELEEEFFEFVKEDLLKIQNPTPRELLYLILEKNQKEYKTQKEIEKIIKILKKY